MKGLKEKVSFSVDKSTWHPSPLVGQIVLVTTLNEDGTQHLTYRDEVILLGRIVAASIDKKILEARDPYEYLRMFVYLEGSTYGVVEWARRLCEGIPEGG